MRDRRLWHLWLLTKSESVRSNSGDIATSDKVSLMLVFAFQLMSDESSRTGIPGVSAVCGPPSPAYQVPGQAMWLYQIGYID